MGIEDAELDEPLGTVDATVDMAALTGGGDELAVAGVEAAVVDLLAVAIAGSECRDGERHETTLTPRAR